MTIKYHVQLILANVDETYGDNSMHLVQSATFRKAWLLG